MQVTSESVDSGVSCGGDTPHNLKLASVDDLPGPPDGGWGWVVCFACFACNFVLDGIAYRHETPKTSYSTFFKKKHYSQ